MELEKMITLNEIRHHTGLSSATIARHLRNRQPPFDAAIKIGRRVLVPQSSYQNWALSKFALSSEGKNANFN